MILSPSVLSHISKPELNLSKTGSHTLKTLPHGVLVCMNILALQLW